MTIAEGDTLPEGSLMQAGESGIETHSVQALTRGRKVAIFALPGAFTPTCDSAHLPSFMRTKAGFDAKGVDAILCVAVNDPHVMRAWGQVSGATAAGIEMFSDPVGAWTEALGMRTSAPGKWVDGRSKRYAMYVEDGVVTRFHPQIGPGCETSGGEALLAAI